MLGLILAGGGARGAYEAGVLRFVFEVLPKRTGILPAPRVISGTSVGALNAAWIAAFGADGATRASNVWRNLKPDDVYHFTTRDLVSLPARLLRASPGAPFSLLDPSPLYRLIRESIDWNALHARIDREELDTMVIATTDVASGIATLFADGARLPRPRPAIAVRRTRMTAEHCLASSAIPFVFPPIQVGGRFHVDGSLRQNTPLAPAISMGVKRALVIGVKRSRGEEAPLPSNEAPTPAFLAGKAMNALMLDPVEEDLRHVQELNDIIEWGERAFPHFTHRLLTEHKAYHHVETVYIRPSEDIGRIAAETFRCEGAKLPWASRMLFHAVAGSSQEADLASYLYFDRSFTGTIEQLGFEDAERNEDRLARLFQPRDEDHAERPDIPNDLGPQAAEGLKN